MDVLALETWQLWLLGGCFIAVVELLWVNSYYLLALAAGAGITGLAASITGLSMDAQWLVCMLATAITALVLHFLRPEHGCREIDHISEMVGKQVQVVESVAPLGRVMYQAVIWQAESADQLPKGASAIIIGVNRSTLFVAKIEEG